MRNALKHLSVILPALIEAMDIVDAMENPGPRPIPPVRRRPNAEPARCRCQSDKVAPFGSRRAMPRPVQPDFRREPDGVEIIVDRPRREDFFSHHEWAMAMANYRMLIDQAKKCDWPLKEIPAHIPNYVHANRRDWYDDNVGRW